MGLLSFLGLMVEGWRQRGEGLQLGLQPVGVILLLMALGGQCVAGASSPAWQGDCPGVLSSDADQELARKSGQAESWHGRLVGRQSLKGNGGGNGALGLDKACLWECEGEGDSNCGQGSCCVTHDVT